MKAVYCQGAGRFTVRAQDFSGTRSKGCPWVTRPQNRPVSGGLTAIEHRLDNGLRLVLSEDHLNPVAAICLWYDVGSRYEVKGRTGLVPLGNTIRSGDLRILDGLGGARVFVDEAAQDGSSVDPFGIDFSHGGAWGVTICAGDVLGDALVRPGRVVVRLIPREDGAEVYLAEDQRPVEDLAAQSAYEAATWIATGAPCRASSA